MPGEDEGKLPQPTKGDHAHLAAKALLSAIPFLGGPAAELFPTLLAPPLSKRRDAWMESLARSLKALEERTEGLKVESLSENEAFISAVMQATQSALRTHQNEKLDALRNAVLKVAAGTAPEENLQSMFLALIDAFTPLHLRLLGIFRNRSSANPEVFQELRAQQPVSDQVIEDLAARGLIALPAHLARSYSSPLFREPLIGADWQLTSLGNQFVSFVSEPED